MTHKRVTQFKCSHPKLRRQFSKTWNPRVAYTEQSLQAFLLFEQHIISWHIFKF